MFEECAQAWLGAKTRFPRITYLSGHFFVLESDYYVASEQQEPEVLSNEPITLEEAAQLCRRAAAMCRFSEIERTQLTSFVFSLIDPTVEDLFERKKLLKRRLEETGIFHSECFATSRTTDWKLKDSRNLRKMLR
eukprot:ANDGO_01292.mRNA.1 hypothetical protein